MNLHKRQAIVGIPLYKPHPDPMETASLRQVFSVLGQHPIVFITHEQLDVGFYRALFPHASFTYFSPGFFASMDGYNRLLLSRELYLRFQDYEYLLIFQTDAWVFRDELTYWCRQGYDYLGAPWFDSPDPLVSVKMNQVGNGGFSLRRIPGVLRWFLVQDRMDVLRALRAEQGTWKTVVRYRATVRALAGRTGDYDIVGRLFQGQVSVFEDLFWSGGTWEEYKDGIKDLKGLFLLFLPWLFWTLRKPSARRASRFAFEVQPQTLYKLNHGRLPFGCHAWAKWQPEFWKDHIPLP